MIPANARPLDESGWIVLVGGAGAGSFPFSTDTQPTLVYLRPLRSGKLFSFIFVYGNLVLRLDLYPHTSHNVFKHCILNVGTQRRRYNIRKWLCRCDFSVLLTSNQPRLTCYQSELNKIKYYIFYIFIGHN